MAAHDLFYVEQNMTYQAMTQTAFLQIIALTRDAKDIIASNHLKLYEKQIDNMRLSRLYEWLTEDKRRFKRPIIVDFERGLLHIGYHSEALVMFMTRGQRIAYRKQSMHIDYK